MLKTALLRPAFPLAILVSALVLAGCATSPAPHPPSPSAEAAAAAGETRLAALDIQRHIRSGRHVDLVIDDEDFAYLATFTRPDVNDEIQLLIHKLDAEGRPVWTIGPGIEGRATSLARAPGGDIWVAGFVKGAFPWETAEPATRRARPFLVRLSPEGQVLATRFGQPGLTPELVRVAPDGSLLLTGSGRGEMSWDGTSVRLEGLMDEQVIAGFDAEGRCLWMRALTGRATTSQLAATPEGDWILGGQFIDTLELNGDRLATESPMDADAFMVRLAPEGRTRWLRRFGRPGNARPGARSREMIRDFYVSAEGRVMAAAILDDDEGGDRLVVLELSPEGEARVVAELALDVRPPASLAIAANGTGGTFLAYKRAVGDARYQGLALIGGEGDVLIEGEEVLPANTMIRSAAFGGGSLWLAGHFQGAVSWGGQRLTNEGDHELFVLVLKAP